MSVETMQFVFPMQGATNLRELNRMREEALLTDVTIVAEEREFKCHRAVLAASCPYFKAMFSRGLRECFENTVTLYGVKANVMEMVLQYAYTGTCLFSRKIAAELLTAADLFGLLPLREAAAQFLRKCIDVNNCMQIRRLADEHCCKDVYEAASQFSCNHFTDIVQQNEFLDLHLEDVVAFLSDDDLNVLREDLVFDAAMRWIRHNASRAKFIEKVLKNVRLPFVKPEYLKLQATVDPLIYHNTTCIRQLLEARTYQISGVFLSHIDSDQWKPRKSTSKEVLLVFGGEARAASLAKQSRDAFFYDLTTKTWESMSIELDSIQATAFTIVSLGYEIYVTGGTINSRAITNVQVFFTYLSKWHSLTPMRQARYHHACVETNGKLYAIGGTDGRQCLRSMECFEPTENVWGNMKPLIHAVKCPAVTSLRNSIYVFGGFTDQYTMCQKLQVFNIETVVWTVTTSTSIGHTCAHAAELNSKIYLLGGSSKIVKEYDPEVNEIIRVADMKQKRGNCGVTAVDGKLFVTGGVRESTSSTLDSVECFCPSTNEWEILPSMPKRLHRHGSLRIRVPIYQRDESAADDRAEDALDSSRAAF